MSSGKGATVNSTHHQSLPSGNLHQPLRKPHPPEGREQKQEELQSCSLWNKNHFHKKIDKMKRQRAMYQMKEQDETPEKQLNEVDIGNLPKKRIQNNYSEDDPGPRKKNGDKDREDARNV